MTTFENTTTNENTEKYLSADELREAERLVREVHAAQFEGTEVIEHEGILPPLGGAEVRVRRGPVTVERHADSPEYLVLTQETTTWVPRQVREARGQVRQMFSYHGRPTRQVPRSELLKIVGSERGEGSSGTRPDGSEVEVRTSVLIVRQEVPVLTDRPENPDRSMRAILGRTLPGLSSVAAGAIKDDGGVKTQEFRFGVQHREQYHAGNRDAVCEKAGVLFAGLGVATRAYVADCHPIHEAGAWQSGGAYDRADHVLVGVINLRWRERVEL